MPDESDIILSPELTFKLQDDLKHAPIIYISGVVGCGKTSAVRQILMKRTYTYLPLSEKLSLDVPESASLVIIDDLHVLYFYPDLQAELCALLRNAPASRHFVLLSRAPLPDYLLPFAINGKIRQLNATDFVFDIDTFSRMLKSYNITLEEAEMHRILSLSRGYAVAVRLFCITLAENPTPVTQQTKFIIKKTFSRLFSYLDGALYSHWSEETRRFLLSIALFSYLPSDLLFALFGADMAARELDLIKNTTNFLHETDGVYSFQLPFMREYLEYKAQQFFSPDAIRRICEKGAQWYEANGRMAQAIESYAKADDHTSLVRVLIANAQQHPGVGAYIQTTQYYAMLSEAEILSSPELIGAMSMLSSIDSDIERAEYWYGKLKEQLKTINHNSAEYKNARNWLLYLDIALPHRGNAGLDRLLPAIYVKMRSNDIQLPEFSVTSNLPSLLNGGKDFSSWVPRDKLLYNLLSHPVEALLGRMGVGLPPLALAESQYEKGEDISGRFVTLMSLVPKLRKDGTPEMEFVLIGLQSRVLCDQNEWDASVKCICDFRQDMQERGFSQLLPNIDALHCRVSLLEDDVFADTWFREQAPSEQPFITMDRYRYLTKIRCYLNQQEHFQALTLAGTLLSYFEQYHRTLNQIETLILLAICRFRMEATDWADYLSRALELGQRYGYIAVFAWEGIALLPLLNQLDWQDDPDYFQRVLEATQKQSILYPKYLRSSVGSIPQLNNMERKVLRLICSNKSNADISIILNISKNTVKTHIRHLFAKLGAKNRNEAREIAHRLHLDQNF